MKIEETLKTQKVWGWEIAAYLFLVGVGAGAYLVGFTLNLIHPEFTLLSKLTTIFAAPLVIIGALYLLLDLGRKNLAILAFSRPLSSWMAAGTVIMTVFVVLDLLQIGLWIWPSTWLGGAPGAFLALESVTSVFAVLTLVYTGMLLGSNKPIPFWNAWFLPVLFLVSGISTAIMGVALLLSIYGLSAYDLPIGLVFVQPIFFLARYNAIVIIVEALILYFYLWRMRKVVASRASVHSVTRGNLAAHFWGGVVVAGLLIPFVFEIYKTYLLVSDPMAMFILVIVASVIGLIGGFMLRYVIIAGGISTPLNVKGVFVPRPTTYRAKVL
jgi:formate-dependent nitrite reductase membrane component NrfD